jgi:PAS domain S-box-containing protein
VFVDHQARIVRYTPSATQVINLIPGDIGRPVGHVMSNLVELGDFSDVIWKVLETLVPHEAEVKTKAGSWFLMRVRPYRTIENVIEGAVLTFIDVSERKRAVEALAESENRFYSIFDRANAGVMEIDGTGRLVLVNARFCEMLGYDRDTLLRQAPDALVHPDDRHRHRVAFASVAAGGPASTVELRYLQKDGTPIWVTERAGGLPCLEVGANSLVVIVTDASERRRLEMAVAASDRRLAADLDSISRLVGLGALRIRPGTTQAVLDEILDTALNVSGGNCGIFDLWSDPAGELVPVASKGLDSASLSVWGRSRDGVRAAALEQRKRVLINDVRQTPSLAAVPLRGVEAMHVTPVTGRGGKPLGTISIFFETSQPDEQSFRFLDLLVGLTADILEHAGLDNVIGTSR